MTTTEAPTLATAPPEARAGTRPATGARITRMLTRAPVAILLAVIGIAWLVPTLGLLLTSLLLPSEIQSTGWWNAITDTGLLSLENYRRVLDDGAITSSLWTTVWISVGGTLLPIIVGALAAYAFAFLEFPGRDWLFIIVVGLLVVPIQMALIPIFSLYNDLGIFDTIIGLILFHTAFGLPFAIFLLRNFFVGIPRELLEAARIDGASELRIFARVIMPLGLPAIASLAIFQFLWTWNDLLIALTLGRDTQPITVAIFSQLRQFGSNIEVIAPAAFISLVIPLAVFFAFQRYFVQGLLAGSVK
ncbi:MAG: carbohydrate ABC transporter permease [Thermoleophilia bacterium]